MKWVRFVSSFTTLVAVLIAGPSNTRLVASPPNTLPDAQKQWAAEPLGLPLKFANAKIYNSGTFENDFVAVGDLNGDGHPDVVVVAANASPSILGVLLGKGDGTFNAPVTYVAGGNSSSAVVIGDVNGDGFLDLVVANESASNSSGEGDVRVLLGNGNGTFQPAVNYDSGGSDATALAIADVNGDKHPDIVVVNRCDSECTGNGTVGVLLNDGKGSFLAPILYSSGALLPDSVAVGDFTGDGKPDIVVAHKCAADGECNTSNGSLGVLLNNGDGTFKAPVVYGSGGYLYALAVAVADMNGDGKLDLIVGNWCESIAVCGGFTPTGGVSVLLGNGNGTFQLPVAYAAGTGNAASIAVGDANGDGHPDVLVNGAEDEDVYILLGNGDGTLQAPVGFASDVQTTVAVALEDLNGDGRPDVVVGDRYASISVLLNKLTEPASIGVASSANPALINQQVTLTATVTSASPIPDGTVITFHALSELGTGITTKGVASLTTSFTKARFYSISATFAGDPFHGKKTGYLTGGEIVTLYPSTTTVVSSPNPSSSGQPVTLTATVSSAAPGGPTGRVSFTNGTTWLGAATLSGGTPVVTTKKLPIGTLTITAKYEGDAQSSVSSGMTSQTVQ